MTLTNEAVELLTHYSERERIINGLQRGQAHQQLLSLGYITEQHVNIQDLLITVTEKGRAALNRRSV